MAKTTTISSPASLKVAFIGNPNTGKSTLFNSLAGLQSRTGNFPGVTVEKKIGRVIWEGRSVDLIDLPGAYSLSPRSIDEMVSVDVLLGRQAQIGKLDAAVCIVDASNLERNLYLVSQILDLGVPAILVVNMWDTAQARKIDIDIETLQSRLGLPVVKTVAHRKRGLDEVRQAILAVAAQASGESQRLFPSDFYAECDVLSQKLADWGLVDTPAYLVQRMVLDHGGHIEAQYNKRSSGALSSYLAGARERLKSAGCRIPVVEARVRYDWARQLLDGLVKHPSQRPATRSDRIDRWLTHRWAGLAFFGLLMFIVFQAIYTWAEPVMGCFESAQAALAAVVATSLPPGALRSLLVDGVIAGVGGVLIFLPQIAFLFFFIAILEDCGYMARAAFLMDRLLTKIGLSGKSFVPLMSSFACAIPGVMATRVIENRRDRMVTILVAPLMSCSARLPVYLLLIAAFIPAHTYLAGWVSLHGLVLFGMSSLGLLVAIPVAWFLKMTFFKGETPPFVMELPIYKWPSPRIVWGRVYDRSKAFTVRAGTLIFATTIVVWSAGYFPGDHRAVDRVQVKIEALQSQIADIERQAPSAEQQQRGLPMDRQVSEFDQRLAGLRGELDSQVRERNKLSGTLIAESLLGQAGRLIEPAVKPLGWDWRLGVGALASFPAREVIIATMGTIYSLGGDLDESDSGLIDAMHAAAWPDGSKVYNIPVALSIMVFFALCAQCASTLMVIRRETNTWVWPAFSFSYMTALAYLGALVTYQAGMWVARL